MNTMKKFISLLTPTLAMSVASMLALGPGVGLAHGQALPPAEMQPGGPLYMPGEVLVKFKETVNDAEIADSFRQGGLKLIKHVQTPAMKDHGHIGLTHVGTPLSVPAAVRLLNNLPGVELAQPNWVYTHASESNDPFYTDG